MVELKQIELIENEECVGVEELPTSWQSFLSNEHIKDKDAYLKMARLFLHKMKNLEMGAFERSDSKDSYSKFFENLAMQALEFYGSDFKKESYPNFDEIQSSLDKNDLEYENRIRVLDCAKDLFKEFGYEMPASFYYVHLAPIYRDTTYEIVPLRFSAKDKSNARSWDAALHGQKVFAIQMAIQSISSKHGLVWQHGCGCNHGGSRLASTSGVFDYKIPNEMRRTWIRDYLWTLFYEYAYFDMVPVTKFLVPKA